MCGGSTHTGTGTGTGGTMTGGGVFYTSKNVLAFYIQTLYYVIIIIVLFNDLKTRSCLDVKLFHHKLKTHNVSYTDFITI